MAVNVGQRQVPDTASTARCYAVDATLDLAEHTLKNCRNKKHFLPEDEERLTIKIVNAAVNAYKYAFKANKIRVTTIKDWNDREKLQLAAIDNVGDMEPFINLARRSNHLRRGKTQYWISKSNYALAMLKKWHTADRKRYKDIA